MGPTASGPTPTPPEPGSADRGTTVPPVTEPSVNDDGGDSTIHDAEAAWSEDRYADVRNLLEPLAAAGPLDDRVERETVLTLLADATLADDTLPATERQTRATKHLERLMRVDPDWHLPRKVFSPELYELYLDLREAQIDASQNACQAGLLACEADADNVQAKLRLEQRKLAEKQREYDDQPVAIGEKRSRALAIFPLGISHFLNGDRAIGAAFLAGEAVFAIAGLTLLAYRSSGDGCRRTARFQTGSLKCDPRSDSTTEEVLLQRRKAEEGMAWAFLGTAALDIVLAQVRFKSFEIVDVKPRKEVEAEMGRGGGGRPLRKRKRAKPRAKVRPRPAMIRAGAGFGLDITF